MRRLIAMVVLVGCGGLSDDAGGTDADVSAKFCGFDLDPLFEAVASTDQVPPGKPVIKKHTVTKSTSTDPRCERMVQITFDIEASDDTTPANGLGYVVSVTGGIDILPHTSGPTRLASNNQMHLFVSVATTGGFSGDFGAAVFDGGGNRSEEASYTFMYIYD